MPDQPFAALLQPDLIGNLQPGLLGIKPVMSHEALDERLPNSEIEKIANDVLAAARLSLTSTLADEAGVRAGTAEEALVGLAKQFPVETQAAAKERAKALSWPISGRRKRSSGVLRSRTSTWRGKTVSCA
jgi:hypothetical protein